MGPRLGPSSHLTPPFHASAEFQALHLGCLFMLCGDMESAEKKKYVQLIPSYLAVISKMLKGRKQRNGL